MTGDRAPTDAEPGDAEPVARVPAVLDLLAPVVGLVGLVAAASHRSAVHHGAAAGRPDRRRRGVPRRGHRRDAARPLVPRAAGPAAGPLHELVRWRRGALAARGRRVACARPGWSRCSTARSTTATAACSAGSGSSCAVTTIVLVVVTRAALKERSYSAVMAATGLLYLAILTAFGTDLLPARRSWRERRHGSAAGHAATLIPAMSVLRVRRHPGAAPSTSPARAARQVQAVGPRLGLVAAQPAGDHARSSRSSSTSFLKVEPPRGRPERAEELRVLPAVRAPAVELPRRRHDRRRWAR